MAVTFAIGGVTTKVAQISFPIPWKFGLTVDLTYLSIRIFLSWELSTFHLKEVLDGFFVIPELPASLLLYFVDGQSDN
jgi:hypothetical protein